MLGAVATALVPGLLAWLWALFNGNWDRLSITIAALALFGGTLVLVNGVLLRPPHESPLGAAVRYWLALLSTAGVFGLALTVAPPTLIAMLRPKLSGPDHVAISSCVMLLVVGFLLCIRLGLASAARPTSWRPISVCLSTGLSAAGVGAFVTAIAILGTDYGVAGRDGAFFWPPMLSVRTLIGAISASLILGLLVRSPAVAKWLRVVNGAWSALLFPLLLVLVALSLRRLTSFPGLDQFIEASRGVGASPPTAWLGNGIAGLLMAIMVTLYAMVQRRKPSDLAHRMPGLLRGELVLFEDGTELPYAGPAAVPSGPVLALRRREATSNYRSDDSEKLTDLLPGTLAQRHEAENLRRLDHELLVTGLLAWGAGPLLAAGLAGLVW